MVTVQAVTTPARLGARDPLVTRRFLVVTLAFENNGRDPQPYAPVKATIVDGAGATYPVLTDTRDAMPLGILAANDRASGQLVFEVPEQRNDLSLVYESNRVDLSGSLP
jgi:hypothetical protein